jgi:hypothetical protein
MGRATQPRRVNRYTLEFKLSAVQLSKLRGVQIQDVAQCQRQPNFPRFGNSIFPTRLRTVVFV